MKTYEVSFSDGSKGYFKASSERMARLQANKKYGFTGLKITDVSWYK